VIDSNILEWDFYENQNPLFRIPLLSAMRKSDSLLFGSIPLLKLSESITSRDFGSTEPKIIVIERDG